MPRYGPSMAIDWKGVWADTADRLRVDVDRGLGHLVSESVLRWMAIEALASHGVDGHRIVTEVLYPELPGARVDLVVDGSDVVELKMPHGSRTSSSPLTQHLGSLLVDFQRVAVVPAVGRWVVQVTPTPIGSYLGRLALGWPLKLGDELHVTPAVVASLPATARGKMFVTPVTPLARCVLVREVGGGFTLRAYEVN